MLPASSRLASLSTWRPAVVGALEAYHRSGPTASLLIARNKCVKSLIPGWNLANRSPKLASALLSSRIHSIARRFSSTLSIDIDVPPSQATSKRPVEGVTVVNDAQSAAKALQVLTSPGVRDRFHACDTEVINIDVKNQSPVGNGHVICATIYCGPDVDFGSGPRLFIDNLDSAAGTLALFRSYFEDDSIKKVWHNYSFDRHVMHNAPLSINVRGFGADTMHMARLWDAARTREGGYSLEALTDDVLGADWRKAPMKERFGIKKKRKDGQDGKLVLLPPLEELQRGASTRVDWIDYATFDACSTWHLRAALEERLREMPWAGGKDMYEFYMTYWRPFGELLTDMEREGIFVRVDFLGEVRHRALNDIQSSRDQFLRWAMEMCPGAKNMNVSSDAQKQQLLLAPYRNAKGEVMLEAERKFSVDNEEGYIEVGETKAKRTREFTLTGLGIPVLPDQVTAAGKPAVSLEVLRELAGSKLDSDKPKYGRAYTHFAQLSAQKQGKSTPDHAAGVTACRAIDALCRVSAIETLLTNFIDPLLLNADSRSRVHCSLNLNTETGRLSSRRPNLQNQPALEKDIYKIRDAFACDPRDQTAFIVADYGQLELRVLAHIANCKSMIDAFALGGDFHSRTAIGMYDHVAQAVQRGEVLLEWDYGKGEPPKPLLKDVFGAERRKAKTLNFSIAYGKTARGLARDWDVSLEEAQDTVRRWYSDRPEVKAWQDETIRLAHEQEATRTLMGRYRPLKGINAKNRAVRSHLERAAINTPIQGGAADVVMKAMLLLHANERFRALGWRLLLQIHDEIICEGPQASVDEAMIILKECMSRPFHQPLRVELVVDAASEQTWYRAK